MESVDTGKWGWASMNTLTTEDAVENLFVADYMNICDAISFREGSSGVR